MPTAGASTLAPVLQALEPFLEVARRVVAPRWAQRLVETLLSTFAIAYEAVLELPNRQFTRQDAPLLQREIDEIGLFFMRACRGILEPQLVEAALHFLYPLAESACSR